MTRVAVLGAHSAIAKALLECLNERGVELSLKLATTTDHLTEGLELISDETLAWADLVVLTFAGGLARKLAEAARALGKPVLDLAEAVALAPRSRWIFPGLDADAGRAFDPVTFSVVPIGLGAPLVAVLRALVPFAPTRATIATYESTAALDEPGMDELSEQVRARFNMRESEPKVFGSAIAFGCLPVVGGPLASPFEADEVLRQAIEAGVEAELEDLDLVVTRVLVPTFSADAAVLVVDTAPPGGPGVGGPERVEVETVLKKARGVHYLGAELPSSYAAIGRDDALVGRLSVEAGRISVWIAVDRLRRGSATLGALALESWIEGRGPAGNGHAQGSS